MEPELISGICSVKWTRVFGHRQCHHLFFNQICPNELWNTTDYHLHTSNCLSDECVKTSCSLVYTIALPNYFWVIPKTRHDRLKGKPRLGLPRPEARVTRLKWLVPRVIWADSISPGTILISCWAECGKKQKYKSPTYNSGVFFEKPE